MIEPIAPASFTVPNGTSTEVVITQSHRDEARKGQDFWTRLTVDLSEHGQILLKVDVHNTKKPELEGYLTLTKEQTNQLASYLQNAIKSAEEREQYIALEDGKSK
jgi:hypothetical protein